MTLDSPTTHHWIGVASRSHVHIGRAGGFVQMNHGKAAGVRRLKAGDGVVMYSPRTDYPDGDVLQAFTAIGRVRGGVAYQVEMFPGFVPWRVDVDFVEAHDAPIRPLITQLSFIRDPHHWGAAFRFGQVKITAADFAAIAQAMLARHVVAAAAAAA